MVLPLASRSSHFQTILDAALRDYERQTGTKLSEHPLAKQLETCDSVRSITAVLQKQAQGVSKFRGEDSKAMKSLKRGVHVLFSLSDSTLLGEGVGVVRPSVGLETRSWKISDSCCSSLRVQAFPPARAIFAGLAVLLSVCVFLHSLQKYLCDKSYTRPCQRSMRAMTRSSTWSSP